jgi:hypothetical protein
VPIGAPPTVNCADRHGAAAARAAAAGARSAAATSNEAGSPNMLRRYDGPRRTVKLRRATRRRSTRRQRGEQRLERTRLDRLHQMMVDSASSAWRVVTASTRCGGDQAKSTMRSLPSATK